MHLNVFTCLLQLVLSYLFFNFVVGGRIQVAFHCFRSQTRFKKQHHYRYPALSLGIYRKLFSIQVFLHENRAKMACQENVNVLIRLCPLTEFHMRDNNFLTLSAFFACGVSPQGKIGLLQRECSASICRARKLHLPAIAGYLICQSRPINFTVQPQQRALTPKRHFGIRH